MKHFKIVQLRAENFKRLKAVEINPDGSVVVIRGENGAGKSSVIDAIWAALGGKRACPEQPVRQGEERAVVSLDLGDLMVTRTFTPKDTYLSVRNKDGAFLSDPQRMLDSMIGAVGFDPFDFARKSAKEQAKMLAQVAGLDFAEMNVQRKIAYDQRTDANREVKRLEAIFRTKQEELDGQDEAQFTSLTSIDEVLSEQRAAHARWDEHSEVSRRQLSVEVDIDKLKADIAELQRILEKREAEYQELTAKIAKSANTLPDLDGIAAKLHTVNDHNEKVRAFADLRSTKGQLIEAQDQAFKLDEYLKKIDREKQLQIEKAQLPVDGLLFDENGIYLNGIPFDQCCASEQLKISIALAMKLNPQIRVIRILDGSLLDSKSMAIVRELAEKHDFQVWIEVVDESADGPGVLIQDGTIVE